MVELNFNLEGYRFQDVVKSLRRSFTLAIEAAHEEHERAIDDAFGYQQHIEQGGEWIGEMDDEGFILWDKDQVLASRVDAAQIALADIRKAFIIALYHQWERSTRKWTKVGSHAKHKTLVAALETKGVQVHTEFDTVKNLANDLKHDAGTWDAIEISDKVVSMAFDIVAASGPTPKTPITKLSGN